MGVDLVDAGLRDRWNQMIGSVMDDGLAANRVPLVPARVEVKQPPPKLMLMGSEDNLGVAGQGTHARAEQNAKVKQLEGGIVDHRTAHAMPGPWVIERGRVPLRKEGLFEVLVEVLLAWFAEQPFSQTFLKCAPRTVAPVRFADAHHVSLVVVKVSVEKLRDDVGFTESAAALAAKAAMLAKRRRFGDCHIQHDRSLSRRAVVQ